MTHPALPARELSAAGVNSTGDVRGRMGAWIALVAIVAGTSVAANGVPAHHARGVSPPALQASSVRICAGGDVTLGSNLDTAWIHRMTGRVLDSLPAPESLLAAHLTAPESLVARLRPLMAGSDIVLINAEGAIGSGSITGQKCIPDHKLCYLLRSSPSAARALRVLADTPTAVVVNVANNHTRDAGPVGFATTVALLDSAHLLVTGADPAPTLVATASGDTTAILGFSAWTEPGVEDTAAVRRLVASVAARYPRVVVTAHLGAEGHDAQRTPNSLERFGGERRGNPVAFAHAAVDAGAGLVVGHGPHVLRGAEWRHGALIFYSLGNLLNYGPFDLREPMSRGAVACASLDAAGRPHDVVLWPTIQTDPGIVRLDATRRRALTLVDSLSRLDFPRTRAAVDRATGAVTLPPDTLRSRPHRTISHHRHDQGAAGQSM